VIKFGSVIQINANTFKNNIHFSDLLSVLVEVGVEVVRTTVSAINHRVGSFIAVTRRYSLDIIRKA
jgi:hypothetical protein